MPVHSGEAIVIRSWRYGEADLIVSAYSREFGKIRCIAKGARRSRSRFGLSLQQFNHAMLQLFVKEKGTLHQIRGVDVLQSFFTLASEWEKLKAAAMVVGLIDLVTPEAEPSDKVFDLLLETLHLLQGTSDPDRVAVSAAIKLLALSGYEPELEMCVRCTELPDERPAVFLPSAGGIVCSKCALDSDVAIPLSHGTVRFLRKALTLSLQKGQRLRLGKKMRQEVQRILFAAYGAAIGESSRLAALLELSCRGAIQGGSLPSPSLRERGFVG